MDESIKDATKKRKPRKPKKGKDTEILPSSIAAAVNAENDSDEQDIYEKIFSMNINEDCIEDVENKLNEPSSDDKQFYNIHDYKNLNLNDIQSLSNSCDVEKYK